MTGGTPLGRGTELGGRYRLERALGSGGMASVWLAGDKRLSRPVAVKVLSDVLATDNDYVRRFRREARVAAGLSHPNLVRVYDFSARGERPYVVMELVEGGTLADRIGSRAAGRFDIERLARDLLGALDHIHGAGIVHRDLKPANVLIDRDGKARLTDFGIAQPSDATKITQTGQVVGTREYMAPEVLAGKPASERSDLYSLGVLLGECLGRRPPARVSALVESLRAEDPRDRPASASDALELLAGRAPITPTAVAPGDRIAGDRTAPTRRMERGAAINRPRRAAALAGLAALAAAIAAAALIGGGGDSTEPRSADTEKRSGNPSPDRTVTVIEQAPPAPATPATNSCADLETQRAALDEERKATEGRLKDDHEARKQAHERFKDQERALDEQLKSCEEGGAAGGDGDRGRGGEGGEGEGD